MKIFKCFTLGWSEISSMNHARRDHTASILSNGKVLVTGGFDNNALNSAELYDPSSKMWTTTGAMITARRYHTATILTNGKVLVFGGTDSSGYLKSAEVFVLY